MQYCIRIVTMVSVLMIRLSLHAETQTTVLLITQVKDDLSHYLQRLTKAGYTLETIPYTMNSVIRNRLSNASINEVVSFANALLAETPQWQPLIKPTLSFLLNKKLIQDFGLRQRFTFWLGIKNLDTLSAEHIAQKRQLNQSLYKQLNEQVAMRNRRQGHRLYTVADYLLALEKQGKTLQEVERYDADTGAFSVWGLISSAKLKLNNLSLTSIEGLRLISPTIAQNIATIDLSNNNIDTIANNEFNAFPKLKWIYCNQNKLSNIESSVLNGFTGELDITYNPISVPAIEKLHSELPNVTISTCSRRRWKGEKCMWLSKKASEELKRNRTSIPRHITLFKDH